jgi:hypothetical protein
VTGEPELAALARRFPRWETWKGVSGRWYARLLRSSPPVVLQGEDAQDMADQIMRADALREG